MEGEGKRELAQFSSGSRRGGQYMEGCMSRTTVTEVGHWRWRTWEDGLI
jgi:hypothetical protein